MEISTSYFKYYGKSKTFCCNVNTIRAQDKQWTPYTHSLVLCNPKTNGKRHFRLVKAYSNHYLFECGDIGVKVYYQSKDSQPKQNLFVADKGGIVKNFMEDYIHEIENAEQYYLV